MRQRAKAMNGNLYIQSIESKGTKIYISVPLSL